MTILRGPRHSSNEKGPVQIVLGLRSVSVLLQLDRFDLIDESVSILRQKRINNVEYRVAESTDVQDVLPVRSLRIGRRLNVDADQTRIALLAIRKFVPLRHHRRRTVSSLANPTFVVADQYDSGERSFCQPTGIGFRNRNGTVGTTADKFRQALRKAENRVTRVDAYGVGTRVKGNEHTVRIPS